MIRKITELPTWVHDFFEFEEKRPINRLAYTKEDMIYKVKVMRKMQQLGMTLTVDTIGNICGTLKGKDSSKTGLVFCSHTDSVPDGGQYDGCVGVIMPLVAIEEVMTQGGVLEQDIKVIICACEESSRFNEACLGSKFLNGTLAEEKFTLLTAKNGTTLQEAVAESFDDLVELGMTDFTKVEAVIDQGECEHAIEIHIEQYESLQVAGQEIGIVNSIVSPYRFETLVKGVTGHTGTAPMASRKDAVVASSIFVTILNQWALTPDSNLRIAVPKFETDVNYSMNKIADRVTLATDIRMQYPNHVDRIGARLKQLTDGIADQTGTTFELKVLSAENPVKTSDELSQLLFDLSVGLGLKTVEMPSWAGHDMAHLPAKNRSLIFIPSTNGSHNPDELTTVQDVLNGINLLSKATLELVMK